MSQDVFCINCGAEIDAASQVFDILSDRRRTRVELEELEVVCCEMPNLRWVSVNPRRQYAVSVEEKNELKGEMKHSNRE